MVFIMNNINEKIGVVMFKRTALLGFSMFILSPALYAGDNDLSRQYSNCMDRSDGVTVNMLDCIAAETDRQDTRLNNAYKQTMASLNANRKNSFKRFSVSGFAIVMPIAILCRPEWRDDCNCK